VSDRLKTIGKNRCAFFKCSWPLFVTSQLVPLDELGFESRQHDLVRHAIDITPVSRTVFFKSFFYGFAADLFCIEPDLSSPARQNEQSIETRSFFCHL
jgi:hypothetical protein